MVDPWIWGNDDEHLTTNLCLRSEQVLTDDRGRWGHGNKSTKGAPGIGRGRRQSVRQIKRLNALTDTYSEVPEHGRVHQNKSMFEKSNLCRLEDADGNRFRVCEVYVRIFAFHLATLRFVVTAENNKGPPSISHILGMQDIIHTVEDGKGTARKRSSQARVGQVKDPRKVLKMFNYRTGQAMGNFNTSSFLKV